MSDTFSSPADVLASTTSRRRFLRTGTFAALAAGVACKSNEAKAAPSPQTPSGQTGGTMGAHDTSVGASALASADAMDAMHEKAMKAFPAKTAVHGNQVLKPRVVDNLKVFELTAKKIQWETEPGKFVEAWSYNDQVPGPQIRVREGDRVRVILHNQLPESTAVHFHGLELPNDMDGVTFITQPPVKAGQSFTYEFTVPNAGSHMYHSHHNSAKQVGLGLLGAFIVEPKVKGQYDDPDVDEVNVAPGERWDVIVNCNNPGTWAFHCHILPHAESEHGMFGMVTALVVQK